MPDNTVIPSDDATQNLKPIYSINRLVNGDAETGSTSGWETQGASVVIESDDNPNKMFKLIAGFASMKQVVSAGGSQPPDFQFVGSYLPDRARAAEEVQVKAYAKLTLNYADGTKDVAMLPVRGAVSNGA